MAVSDIQAVLSSLRWTDEALYLKEFVHKHKLPQIAKVLTSSIIVYYDIGKTF